MLLYFKKSFLLIIFSCLFILGCSKNENSIDLSNLPKPKVIDNAKSNDKLIDKSDDKAIDKSKNQKFIADLVLYKDQEQILDKFKYGKKDPFSKVQINNTKLNFDFKLTGFLNANNEKYAFVSYLNNEGIIKEGSVGGVNTFLLPDGAKVISVNQKQKKLIINFEKKDFIFEL